MFKTKVMISILLSVAAYPALGRSQDQPQTRTLIGSGELGLGVTPDTYSLSILFALPQVQKSLKVTGKQLAQVKELREDQGRAQKRLREEYDKSVEELGEIPDRQALRDLRKRRSDAMVAIAAKGDEALRKTLDRQQFARLRQIQMQAEGAVAFGRPEVQKQLNLSPEQIDTIQSLAEEGHARLIQVTRVPSDRYPDLRSLSADQIKSARDGKIYKDMLTTSLQNVAKVRAETKRAIMKVLTKLQRERYERMLGEPFDFTKASDTASPKASDKKEVKKSP